MGKKLKQNTKKNDVMMNNQKKNIKIIKYK